MTRTRRIVTGIAILAGLQAGAVLLYLRRERAPAPVPFAVEALTPRPAPALTGERRDGTRVSLSELRGRPVLVHFWATWCKPCEAELPGLLALAQSRSLTLLAVSVDDDWTELETFFRGSPPATVLRPSEPNVHARFGASTLPDTYVVNTEGHLVARYAGARDWTTAAARAHVDALTATLRP